MSDSASTGRPSIGIAIPIHNEGTFLAGAIELIGAELDSVPADVQIFLVENGSSDDTASTAARLADERDSISLRELPHADYGAAVRAGFETAATAGADWIVKFDIDYFSGPFVQGLVEEPEGADVVIASKRDPNSDDRRSIVRRAGTLVFNLILRAMLGSRVSDTHGIMAFRREVIDKLIHSVEHNQDLFDTELVLRAERAGYRIKEVPIVVRELRTARSSLFRRIPRTLRGIVELKRSLDREGA